MEENTTTLSANLPQSLVIKYAPALLIKDQSLKTIDNVLDAKLPSLNILFKQNEADLKLTTTTWLIYVNEKLGINNTMSEEDIEDVAALILSDYGFLNFGDLKIFFKNLIMGRYGEFYNNFNIPKFFTMLDVYVEKRLDKGAERSKRKHENFIKNDPEAARSSSRRQ